MDEAKTYVWGNFLIRRIGHTIVVSSIKADTVLGVEYTTWSDVWHDNKRLDNKRA